MFGFSNYSTKSKYCDDSNKLVIGKKEDKTGRDWRIWFVEAKNVFILGRRQSWT